MADGYRVHPDAIEAYAAQLEATAERVSRIISALGSVEVPSDAFGLLPDAHELHTSYREHADADLQDCADLDQMLRTAADGLTTTAGNYRDAEVATAGSVGGGSS